MPTAAKFPKVKYTETHDRLALKVTWADKSELRLSLTRSGSRVAVLAPESMPDTEADTIAAHALEVLNAKGAGSWGETFKDLARKFEATTALTDTLKVTK